MRGLFSCSDVEKLANKYTENGGNVYTIEEGVLGCGTMIMYGVGLKTAIIKEVALSAWSSAHTITLYNKCPKKYEKYTYMF